ncbi:MAG TPA: DUF58 domain-containing protein, partial [Acidimicrobiia bacterium]|nr:DUF58 domain-containing protein [Acidimicrobiia bacterium]
RFTNTGSRAPLVAAEAIDPLGSSGERRGSGAPPAVAPGCDVPGRCLVPALAPGALAEAEYALPTERRGTVVVGPLSIRVADLFGLAERRAELAGPARLVVHPRIHPVLPPPGSATREARHGATRPARAARGDDFFALREYEVGDDLRRVHWRSTARLGDLMLRQDELRFGEVATVLVDTRASAHTPDSFERALEVAASVAAALTEDGRRLRFVTTGGFEMDLDAARSGPPVGPRASRWAAVLEHLALATPDGGRTDAFALAVQSIRHQPSGPLAAVVGAAGAAELAALAALRPRPGLVLIAACNPTPAEPGPGTAGSVPGAIVVAAGAMERFPDAWNLAVLSCGRQDTVRP